MATQLRSFGPSEDYARGDRLVTRSTTICQTQEKWPNLPTKPENRPILAGFAVMQFENMHMQLENMHMQLENMHVQLESVHVQLESVHVQSGGKRKNIGGEDV